MQDIYAGFQKVDYAEPHIGRAKQMLQKYPELKTLFGNTPSTMFHILLLVGLQLTLAFLLKEQPWWAILGVAWFVGALLNHACFVMIHDATHNLVFKGTIANRFAGMVANLPIIFPVSQGFRTFHLLHHRYQGEFDRDADLSGPTEAKVVGNSTVMKILWLLFFFVIEGVVRPARLKNVKVVDSWALVNVTTQVLFTAAVAYTLGWSAVGYLVLSALFSVGLHPVGARWIQEHYTTYGNQETYSYYGPLNYTCYNVGYHNEHHDLMMVPWSKLPKVKAMAPEFYNSLHSYQSWTALLFKFLFSKDLTLYSRVVRPSREERSSIAATAVKMAQAEKVEDRIAIV
ncbi:MAG: fatty acid desaturase [Bdellovibrionales bacterium]|nr:fatty acid desaturase [Bdellovibrionales bacterium]